MLHCEVAALLHCLLLDIEWETADNSAIQQYKVL
jgi:hypothetical protein